MDTPIPPEATSRPWRTPGTIRRRRAVLATALALLAAARLWQGLDSDGRAAPSVAEPSSAACTTAATDRSERDPDRGVPPVPELADEVLLRELRLLATVDRRDETALEERLAPFLANPANLVRVLDLIQGGVLDSGDDGPSGEEIGALRALVRAVAVLHPVTGAFGELELAGVDQDRFALLARVLTSIAELAAFVDEGASRALTAERDPTF